MQNLQQYIEVVSNLVSLLIVLLGVASSFVAAFSYKSKNKLEQKLTRLKLIENACETAVKQVEQILVKPCNKKAKAILVAKQLTAGLKVTHEELDSIIERKVHELSRHGITPKTEET